MNRIHKISLISLGLLLLLTACLTTPQATPQNSSTSNGLPTLDTSNLPTTGPVMTSTAYPTPTRRPTITPFVTETAQPTKELPLNVTLNLTNKFFNDVNVYCQGPYILQYTLKSGEKRTVHIPAGAYTCRVSGLQAGNDLLKNFDFPPGDVFDWTFINQ